MTYIIAFVKVSEATKPFPVNCLRTDLKPNDPVIVRRTDGKLIKAVIYKLQYLSWDCKGRIECKLSESGTDETGGILLPNGSPRVIGMANSDEFVSSLKQRSWIPLKKYHIWAAILANTNSTQIAYILVRRNGLDIQLLPLASGERPKPYSLYQPSLTKGRCVRHSLAHTDFNLYEGIIRFSDRFLNNENIDEYFVPVGESDRRTDELKEKSASRDRARKEARDEMMDIYDACSDGSGGPAYLGDGIWITSDGCTHDRGR